QELNRVAASIANPSIPLALGPLPRTFDRTQLATVQTGVVQDTYPLGISFGSVRTDVQKSYTIGSSVKASFVGGHPKNRLQLVASFCDVEKFDAATGTYKTFLTDAHWDVRFRWTRLGVSESNSECEWVLRSGSPVSVPGTYRLRHRGYSKPLIGDIKAYEGVSASFTVV
ncbi:unnamed protein product, partial [Aphanomyces euteiches]